MGEVYKARDPRLNRLVALKLLPAAAANDAERRERFEREAQAVAALNHPGIVTIHSVEQADGQFFLTMELVEGRSLADAMPPTGLSLDRLLKIAIPVADAMAAAHQKGITHRDLKPGNIMLGEGEHDGRVKVLDFGLAKLAEAPTAAAGATAIPTALPTTPITGEGRILGTVAYMSPEQAEGKPIDARSDLFSLGVILYEMATGQRPFTGDTSISIISSIVKDTPKSVTELNPALPRDLGRIIRRALSKDLERRYQTAKDLRNDLEELKASLDSGELQTSTMASGSLPGGADRSRRAKSRDGHRRGDRGPRACRWNRLLVGDAASPAGGIRDGGPISPGSPDHAVDDERHRGPAGDLAGRQVRRVHPACRRCRGPAVPWSPHLACGSVRWRRPATSRSLRLNRWSALGGLTVTPDGNYVDYVRLGSGAAAAALWRVSFLGGTPKKLLENIAHADRLVSRRPAHGVRARRPGSRRVRVSARRSRRCESSRAHDAEASRFVRLAQPHVAAERPPRLVAGRARDRRPGCTSLPGLSRANRVRGQHQRCGTGRAGSRRWRCVRPRLARRRFPGAGSGRGNRRRPPSCGASRTRAAQSPD